MGTDKLLSLQEVAKQLGRSEVTVWRHVQSGSLKAERVGRTYVVYQSEFDRFRSTPLNKGGRPRKAPPA